MPSRKTYDVRTVLLIPGVVAYIGLDVCHLYLLFACLHKQGNSVVSGEF